MSFHSRTAAKPWTRILLVFCLEFAAFNQTCCFPSCVGEGCMHSKPFWREKNWRIDSGSSSTRGIYTVKCRTWNPGLAVLWQILPFNLLQMPNGLKIDGCHMFHFKHLHLRFSTEGPRLQITNKFSGLTIIERMKIAGKWSVLFSRCSGKTRDSKVLYKKLQWMADKFRKGFLEESSVIQLSSAEFSQYIIWNLWVAPNTLSL